MPEVHLGRISISLRRSPGPIRNVSMPPTLL
jgi:hypothetical protein